MKGIIEKLKSIPTPIWIGLGLVLIVIFLFGGRKTTGGGPVTGATVGAQGAQGNAATDQAVGNLSQMTQTGFNQIMENQKAILQNEAVLQTGQRTGFSQTVSLEQQNQNLLTQLKNGMGGYGTTYTQMGSSIQNSQNQSAGNNAYSGTQPRPVQQYSGPTLWNVPIVDASGGAGSIQVASTTAAGAYQNAYQGGNTPTGPAVAV